VSCSWCEARLAPLVDGELTPRERALALRHVDGCAHCAQLLEELRVIDGLLLRPGSVQLAPNFTFATMAELHDLPHPAERRTPIAALVVCYLVASWLLLVAALVLSPFVLRTTALTALNVVRTVADALGGLGHVVARFAGWTFAIDALFALAVLAALRRARPAVAERLRS